MLAMDLSCERTILDAMIRPALLSLQLLAFALPVLRAAEPPPRAVSPSNPNVIIILADDLGYGDLGSYGSTTIATPRLDQMAREGLRFTAAYTSAPFCSPARAGLLTGRLPARAGLPYVLFPTEHHGLPAAEITIAELLRGRGYTTACIGKWHLGWDAPFRPLAQGFDRFHGLPHTNDVREWKVGDAFTQLSMFTPLTRVEGERVVESPVDQAELTRHYTEEAVAFIRANRDKPFFLYLPHTMPHVPQYASARFVGKSKGGLYGDTVEELDWSTGVILDTLRELKLDARTLVIFTNDNGAPFRGAAANAAKKAAKENFPGRQLAGHNGPLRSGKGTTFEGGVRVPFIAWWPGPRGATDLPLLRLPTAGGARRKMETFYPHRHAPHAPARQPVVGASAQRFREPASSPRHARALRSRGRHRRKKQRRHRAPRPRRAPQRPRPRV